MNGVLGKLRRVRIFFCKSICVAYNSYFEKFVP